MEAMKVTAKPINGKIVIDLPPEMESDYCEVIILKGQESRKEGIKRKPPPKLAETRIHSDFADYVIVISNRARGSTVTYSFDKKLAEHDYVRIP